MNDNKILDKTFYDGYYVQKELVDGTPYGSQDIEMELAYNPNGDYIGEPSSAKHLCEEKGITPIKKRGDVNVCSIGFCEKEQKWYGWSHRTIYGFGIGDKVKKGDCAYVSVDKDDFLSDTVNFWEDEHHVKTWGEHDSQREEFYEAVDGSNELTKKTYGDLIYGVHVKWIYTDDTPNEKLRGTEGGNFAPYPKFGKGEWTAETMEDAKQMAIDFADGVN